MPVLGPSTVIVVQPPAAPSVTVAPPRAPGVTVVPQPGPQGPQGIPGSAGGILYTQSSPSAVWTINTALGRNPYTILVTVGNAVVIGDVSFPTTSQIVVMFPSPATGSVSYF